MSGADRAVVGFADPAPTGLAPPGFHHGECSAIFSLTPITGKAAIKWIAETHRHLPRLQGALFAVGVKFGHRLVGVATAGNPARVWQGTGRFVITRCAVLSDLPKVPANDGDDHASPACTMLYGAMCRAGKALGYDEAWTYTLPHESGKSLRAAGFIDMGLTAGGEHDRPSRPRDPAICAAPKRRWARPLTPIGEASVAEMLAA